MSNKDNNKSASGEVWVHKFNEDSATKFRKEMVEASKGSPKNKPLIVYIDSYGGAVDGLASMIQTMDSIPNPVITVCYGKAMSCGAILLSHGDWRFCTPHSRVMVHEVSSGTFGDVHDNKNNVDESQRLNRYFLGLLAKNCGIKGGYAGLRKIVKEHDGRELWMSAEQALEFGIVDNIGMPKVSISIEFDVTMEE